MAPLPSVNRSATRLLHARILVMLSSGSVAAAVLSAGGCGGDVESSDPNGAGTGGSGPDTTGGTAGQGGTGGAAGSGGQPPGGGTGPAGGAAGGTGAAGGAAGSTGAAGGAAGGTGAAGGAAGGTGAAGGAAGGTGAAGGAAGRGGIGGVAGALGFGGAAGSFGWGGSANCSQPTLCLTCEQLLQRFSHFLDGFSCGASTTCPNLMGAGTLACENVCTPPVAQGDLCCYGLSPSLPACGRPFSVGDEIRRAPVVSRADWKRAQHSGEQRALTSELARALAAEWEGDAALEHASIASFARLTLELLALGAPSELIRESQAASLDEIEHAELCFALASRYRGSPVGPGALAIDGAISRPELATLAAETVREGCVGETLASLLATAQLERASDPRVRSALERIAEDEARHAELSWKIVKWALATGGQAVSDAVSLAFERAVAVSRIEPARIESVRAGSNGEAWHAHGRLLPDERRAVVRSGLLEVIEPCARALLA